MTYSVLSIQTLVERSGRTKGKQISASTMVYEEFKLMQLSKNLLSISRKFIFNIDEIYPHIQINIYKEE